MRDNKIKQDPGSLDTPKEIRGVKLLVFRTIMVLMPLIILAFIELVLRIAGVGKEIPLFVGDPSNEGYLRINHEIARRYFLDPDAAPGVQYPAFRKEKSENSFRVVVQGASTVAGIPYKKGGAFPAMLEQRLNKSLPGKEIEVINTGITAVGTYTLLDLADDIIKIDPDAVIIYAGHNEYSVSWVLGHHSAWEVAADWSGSIMQQAGSGLSRLMRNAHAALAGKKTKQIPPMELSGRNCSRNMFIPISRGIF